MIEAVAGDHDVDRAGDEGDRLRADGQVDGGRVLEEQAVLAEPLGERLDADRDPRGAGVGEAERAGPDVDDHAVGEQLVLGRAGLGGDPADLGARDLAAAALVGPGHLLTWDERRDVAGVEAAGAHDRVPLVEPPAQLGIVVGRVLAPAPQ